MAIVKKLHEKIIWLPTFAAIFLVLNGCSKPGHIELFNNTDSALNITCGGKEIVAETNSICCLSYEAQNGFSVQMGGKLLNYKFPLLDGRKIYKLLKQDLGENTLTVQINSDGSIYVVPPDATLPASQYPEQPDYRFPLQPET